MKLILFILLAMGFSLAFAQTPVSVLTQHNDINRTGWNNQETLLNQSNVTPNTFGLLSKYKVDDQVYAQPLMVSNLTIGSYSGSVLFVATVNNTVYAFDANNVNDTAFLWKVTLNPVGQRSPNIHDLTDTLYATPCGGAYSDFSGKFGLVGTPVIDTVSNTLYVATKTIDSSHNFYAYLNALDLNTGQQKPGSPHLINAQVYGTGAGSVDSVINYQAKFQNQRPALLLYDSTVYVASASYCDWGPYHGWILGFDAATLNLKYSYNATAYGSLGGIWMAGQGISVGADGNLYAVTGNGSTDTSNTNIGGNRGSSLIKLSPQLNLLDWFTPANYAYLNSTDLDYGCDGVLIIPNSTTTISGTKEGISYVVDYNNMGRFDTANSKVKDTLEFNPNRTGFVNLHGSPVYDQLNGDEFVYGWSESFNLRQFKFDRATGTFADTFNQGSKTLDTGMPGAMLSLSSNGADTSSAIVWAFYPSSGNANHEVRPGTLAAYRANNVTNGELWNSDQSVNNVVGKFAKFSSPTVANGKVFVPTFSNAVNIYGVFDTATSRCENNGTGLLAEYFTNTLPTDSFPVAATLIRRDSVINFNWGSGSPATSISSDHFMARFTGSVQSNISGVYTFYVTADDGVRLWVNNQLIIDQWINQAPTEYSASVILHQCTKNTIRLEYFENTGGAMCNLQWAGPLIPKQVIPAIQLYPPVAATQCIGDGTGLQAEYFTNTLSTDTFPAVATIIRTDSVINFNWGSGSPAANISSDHFKARFTGSVQSIDSGAYTFYVTADDGFRLWVNNQLLIDKWIDEGPTEYSATINLSKCTKYAIRLEYYESNGGALCSLKWGGPLLSKQVIPSTQLYSPVVVVANCANDGTGLIGEYFTNTLATDSFPATATVIRTDSVINFNWGTGSPAANISSDHFKARFIGSVQSIDSGAYTFYVTSDDGARLWINNQLVIDKWINQGPTEYSATVNLPQCTKNAIRLEYFENTGGARCSLQWAGPLITKQVIPATQLHPPDMITQCISNGSGLTAEYFTNTLSTDSFPAAATLTRIEPVVNFNWNTGSPAADTISIDFFKARFTGFVQSADSGAYTFYVKADDGLRLWVNDQLVIDKWINEAPTEYSANVNLQGCSKNKIRLEYFENMGGAICTLEWAGPLISKQVIPTIQLYPDTQTVLSMQPLYTDIGAKLSSNYFSVYPNPNDTHSLTVATNADTRSHTDISIYNTMGQMMMRKNIPGSLPRVPIVIPINLESGVYIIKLTTNNRIYTTKFIVL